MSSFLGCSNFLGEVHGEQPIGPLEVLELESPGPELSLLEELEPPPPGLPLSEQAVNESRPIKAKNERTRSG
jgi:hypothetical protein